MGRKIPIGIGEDYFLNVNAYLVSPYIHNPTVVLFYVDTGSPSTIISETEAKKLGIDLNSLKIHPKALGGFGEGRAQAKKLLNLCLVLNDSNDKTYPIEMDEILVSMDVKKTKKEGKRRFKIPNVIGADFFIASRLKLHVDLTNSEAFMESQ